MKQNGKTINSYFIFIILLLLVIFGLNLLNNRTDEYTKAEFIADLDAGNVSASEVKCSCMHWRTKESMFLQEAPALHTSRSLPLH